MLNRSYLMVVETLLEKRIGAFIVESNNGFLDFSRVFAVYLREEIKKKIVALTSSTRSIDLRGDFFLVTFYPPPFSYVHLVKERCESWCEQKKCFRKHRR